MIKKIFSVALALCLVVSSYAQQNMTLYQMHDILQSNSLNPAIASDCRWNVGFPLLGNISIAAGIPISYNGLGAGNDYLDGNDILSSLKKNNIISANVSINILSVGYRAENTYYQFTLNERLSVGASFNKDPIDLLLKGNAPYIGQTLEGKFAASAIYYREYAFNVAHNFGDDMWFGARAKLLFGRAGAHSVNKKITLYTDPNTYALEMNSDLLIRASIPGTVEIDPVTGTVKDFSSDITASDFAFNPSNVGGALDLGFKTTLENGWRLSASILNLGLVSWSKNTHTFTQKSTLKYSGPFSGINSWDDLADTLKSVVKLNYVPNESYSQWLSPAIMVGANYPVSENIRLGITGYSEFNPAGMPWAITATALTDNFSNFYGALSYTVTNNSFVNVGLGLGVKLGAFNIHAVTDNIISVFSPFSQKYATIQFGINFKFGCSDVSSGKKWSSVPCPSYGGSGSKRAIPCPSGKRR